MNYKFFFRSFSFLVLLASFNFSLCKSLDNKKKGEEWGEVSKKNEASNKRTKLLNNKSVGKKSKNKEVQRNINNSINNYRLNDIKIKTYQLNAGAKLKLGKEIAKSFKKQKSYKFRGDLGGHIKFKNMKLIAKPKLQKKEDVRFRVCLALHASFLNSLFTKRGVILLAVPLSNNGGISSDYMEHKVTGSAFKFLSTFRGYKEHGRLTFIPSFNPKEKIGAKGLFNFSFSLDNSGKVSNILAQQKFFLKEIKMAICFEEGITFKEEDGKQKLSGGEFGLSVRTPNFMEQTNIGIKQPNILSKFSCNRAQIDFSLHYLEKAEEKSDLTGGIYLSTEFNIFSIKHGFDFGMRLGSNENEHDNEILKFYVASSIKYSVKLKYISLSFGLGFYPYKELSELTAKGKFFVFDKIEIKAVPNNIIKESRFAVKSDNRVTIQRYEKFLDK